MIDTRNPLHADTLYRLEDAPYTALDYLERLHETMVSLELRYPNGHTFVEILEHAAADRAGNNTPDIASSGAMIEHFPLIATHPDRPVRLRNAGFSAVEADLCCQAWLPFTDRDRLVYAARKENPTSTIVELSDATGVNRRYVRIALLRQQYQLWSAGR